MCSLHKADDTTDDRYWPCTAVNVALVATIVYVSYLVPKMLTGRYPPKRGQARAGKEAPEAAAARTDGGGSGPDRLVTAGVLEDHADGTLSLSRWFENAWTEEVEALRGDDDAQSVALADLLETDPDAIDVKEIDSTGALSVRLEEGSVSQWISQAALIADVAAEQALSAADSAWSDRPVRERHEMLVGLRQFRDACPACGGAIESRVEDTATCCWTRSAVTARCEDCGDRLYVITEHPK